MKKFMKVDDYLEKERNRLKQYFKEHPEIQQILMPTTDDPDVQYVLVRETA